LRKTQQKQQNIENLLMIEVLCRKTTIFPLIIRQPLPKKLPVFILCIQNKTLHLCRILIRKEYEKKQYKNHLCYGGFNSYDGLSAG